MHINDPLGFVELLGDCQQHGKWYINIKSDKILLRYIQCTLQHVLKSVILCSYNTGLHLNYLILVYLY